MLLIPLGDVERLSSVKHQQPTYISKVLKLKAMGQIIYKCEPQATMEKLGAFSLSRWNLLRKGEANDFNQKIYQSIIELQ